MTLTLVRPSREGQDGGRPSRRRPKKNPKLSLSSAERARLRAAIRNLRRAFGSYPCFAAATGLSLSTVEKAGSTGRVSLGFVLAVARSVGSTVERLIGPPVVADACPLCGKGAAR
ncbi:transcriptional regulator [Polyangium spumosum]|uniref:Transcriptional regulator n=1 Tax=Polyangium spumosum TaxID=889282 RepID=A0A6N7PEJ9_9BACT|nr:transcriptional regulator [Polyangium spumosum]MRG90493.1 transcriptional regulator [Polyangium spumosum]